MNIEQLMNLSDSELRQVRDANLFRDRDTYYLTWLVGRKNFGWLCGPLHESYHGDRSKCTGCQAADKEIAALGL